MGNKGLRILQGVAAVAAAFQAFADDAVGVMRVDVSSNETVLAAIPFHPYGKT